LSLYQPYLPTHRPSHPEPLVSTSPAVPSADEPAPPLTLTQWLIVIIAVIGFAFDTYELLMLPLVVRPALQELAGARPGTDAFNDWVGLLFFVPAVAGGVFGLLGGYLTDRLGRRRVLTWSILLYALSAFASGFSTSPGMLLVLRCTTFIGVCVEFVAAIAWLAELFPHPRQRERVLGYTQAFSSVGGLMVAFANGLAVKYRLHLPPVVMPDFLTGLLGSIPPDLQHEAWRYTLMSGLVPALPLLVIRPFLPESPVWQQKKADGTLRRPNPLVLFAPELRRTTIVTTLMVACSFGAAFGAIQQMPQIVPGLPEVQAEVAGKPVPEQRAIAQATAADVTKVQELGGLAGRVVLAVLVVRILSRRALIRVFLVPGLVLMPLVFGYAGVHSLRLLYIGMFLAGLVTVAQYSFWGNYLPLVYPVHLRGTGESVAMNLGGRMIGTFFAAVTAWLAKQAFLPGDSAPAKFAYAAALIGAFVYAVNLIASFALPEPPAEALPEFRGAGKAEAAAAH
jgi:MFS family permease